jgi:hypothetical protein
VGRTKYGSHRVIYHWDGASWTLDTHGKESLNAVWGSGPHDVWAAGSGVLLHGDGTTWSPVTVPGTPTFVGPIWGAAANDVWLGSFTIDDKGVDHGELLRWDGTSWTRVVTSKVVSSLWGTGPNDVWALASDGYDGAILHWDGVAWTRARTRLSGLYGGLGALWGSGPDDVWAAGGVSLLHHGRP